MRKAWYVIGGLAVFALVALVVGIMLQMSLVPTTDSAPPAWASASQPLAAASAASAPPAPTAILNPIEAVGGSPDAHGPGLQAAFAEWFGPATVLSLFELDDFPHRLVATVDNLGQAHAAARLWPLRPVAGRFLVDARDGGPRIGADNEARYAPYLALLDKVQAQALVALYKRDYAQYQKAYQELGYPTRYFNDRLVAVLDQLLATPEPAPPLGVHLPELNSPYKLERPWVLYEFDDPALQALSAGQRILLRMGLANELRVKARLREIRRLVGRPVPASTG